MAPKYLRAVRDNEWRCTCFAPIPTFRRKAICRLNARPLGTGAFLTGTAVRSRGAVESLGQSVRPSCLHSGRYSWWKKTALKFRCSAAVPDPMAPGAAALCWGVHEYLRDRDASHPITQFTWRASRSAYALHAKIKRRPAAEPPWNEWPLYLGAVKCKLRSLLLVVNLHVVLFRAAGRRSGHIHGRDLSIF